ncbi:MAG: hypothetical protein JO134_09570 [Xanthobacteraceae bacterium]|nr:hypothetical protein [Xanthobacteraceae bacterium]
MRVIGYVIAALLAAVCAANAATDELSSLYTQVLQRPADSEISLRYARAAEAAGKLRWAYAAYERVAVNDPSNREAQEGLVRVARRLQPAFTEFLLQAGVSYESNPLYVPTGHTSEAQAFGTLGVKDERTVGDVRWRTTGLAAGIDHTRVDSLNYAYAGATTGPVFDFIGGTQLHLAAGGGGAYFDQHPWYAEGVARAVIEGNAFGAAQSVAFRVAFRDYDSFFPAGQGWYWDVIGRFVAPSFLDSQNTLIFSPWVKRGDAAGTIPVSLLQPGVEPANYIESGGRIELFRQVFDGVLIGPTFYAMERWYDANIVAGTLNQKRQDFIWSPGATMFLPNFFAHQVGLKLEYQYIRDNSNDPTASFVDNVVTASVVARF